MLFTSDHLTIAHRHGIAGLYGLAAAKQYLSQHASAALAIFDYSFPSAACGILSACTRVSNATTSLAHSITSTFP